MNALTQVEWTVAGKVIDQFAVELDGIVKNGTYVPETSTGFLVHFTNALIEAVDAHRAEENAAWDMHKNQNDPNDWV